MPSLISPTLLMLAPSCELGDSAASARLNGGGPMFSSGKSQSWRPRAPAGDLPRGLERGLARGL